MIWEIAKIKGKRPERICKYRKEYRLVVTKSSPSKRVYVSMASSKSEMTTPV
jgi:hypothetical protein